MPRVPKPARLGPIEALWLTYNEAKQSFALSEGSRALAILGLLGIGLLSGLFFAAEDFGRTNAIVSFLAGCVTGPLFLALGYGSLFGGVFLAAFVFRVTGISTKTLDGFFGGTVGMLLLMCFASLLFFSGAYVVSHIPIVNKQLGHLMARILN